MNAALAVLAIAGSLAVGPASPGRGFVMVVRTAVAESRRHGLAAALGMGVGGVAFCLLALLGLQAVFARAEWLYAGFKLAGGIYLLVLAFRMWRHAAEPIDMAMTRNGPAGASRSFTIGLATQLSNPKTLVFYGSVFAALMPRHLPLWGYLVLPPVVMVIETGWYTLVAMTFSLPRARAV